MVDLTGPLLANDVLRIVLAVALGLFMGLEREWSEKPAGVRTFSLISLLGAIFVILEEPILLGLGGLLVITQGIILATEGIVRDLDSLSLTTSVSMLVAYGVGALVGSGRFLAGVAVAVVSSLVLVLKRELHSFAWGLTREELRSGTELAILAFVIYPLLPPEETLTVGEQSISIEPQVIWLMVVTVAAIGLVNYVVVSAFGGRGLAITGFFGGLASSTAVVGTVIDHIKQRPTAASYGIAAILLADAAMAVRNLFIVVAFTLGATRLWVLGVPLLAIAITAGLIAYLAADWKQEFPVDLESPFSLRYALGFGGLFLLVVVAGTVAQGYFGEAGLLATAALAGLVSSAGATTSAVVLFRSGTISAETTALAVLLATAVSIAVKAGMTALARKRTFTLQVSLWSGVLIAVGVVLTFLIA